MDLGWFDSSRSTDELSPPVCSRSELPWGHQETGPGQTHGQAAFSSRNASTNVFFGYRLGSLEVELPTIWTDGKAEVGRVHVYYICIYIYIQLYTYMLYICCTYVVPCYTQCIAISINFNGTTDEPVDFWSGQQLPRSIELEVAKAPVLLKKSGFASGAVMQRLTILLFGFPKAIWQSTWEQASCSVSVVSGSSPCEHLPQWSQIPNQSLLRLKRTQDSSRFRLWKSYLKCANQRLSTASWSSVA